jgi:hypothetical protein
MKFILINHRLLVDARARLPQLKSPKQSLDRCAFVYAKIWMFDKQQAWKRSNQGKSFYFCVAFNKTLALFFFCKGCF